MISAKEAFLPRTSRSRCHKYIIYYILYILYIYYIYIYISARSLTVSDLSGAVAECPGLLDVLLHHDLGGGFGLVLGSYQQSRLPGLPS